MAIRSVSVLRLSEAGIFSDALGKLGYASAVIPAPTTPGQSAAIQAAYEAAWTASGGAGLQVVWDVAVALDELIFLRSNTEIVAPNKGCGAVMRPGTNAPVFMVRGMELPMGNGAAIGAYNLNTQRTFGKFDPAYAGNAAPQNYRVFDPAFVNASNIAITGGTWNGNYFGQTIQPPGTQGSLPFIVRNGIGYTSIMHFFGVSGLRLRDLDCFLGTHFGLNFCNCGDVEISNVDVDQYMDSNYGSDAFHFGGPIQNLRLTNVRTHCADDNIAFNADDLGPLVSEGLYPGVNWQCSGAIRQVRVRNHVIWNGRDNVTGWGAICFRSSAASIDDVEIDGISGVTSNWAIWAPVSGTLVPGAGAIGHVSLRNVSLDLSSARNAQAPIQWSVDTERLQITGRYRRNALINSPDVIVASTSTIIALDLSEYSAYQAAAAANNTIPVVQVAGAVTSFRATASLVRDGALPVVASPVLQVLAGGTVGDAVLDVRSGRISNLVDNAGTIGTLKLRGLHSTVSGGAPLLNTGGTVSNYDVSGLSYPNAIVASYVGNVPTTLGYNELAPVTPGSGPPTHYLDTGTGGFGGAEFQLGLTPATSLDVRMRMLAMPAAGANGSVLMANYNGNSGFFFIYNSTGGIGFAGNLNSSGGFASGYSSTTVTAPCWIRGVVNGSTTTYYTSPVNDGVTWTQIGTSTSGVSIAGGRNSTNGILLHPNSAYNGVAASHTQIARVVVVQDGTTVLDADFTALATGTTNFTATVGGPAAITGGATIV